MEEELRYPASFKEFWETMEECEFKVEYHKNHIISFMSYATDPHELLVSTIVYYFGKLFFEKEDYFFYPSNRPVITPGKSVFNPDASLVIGKPNLFNYKPGRTAITNPAIIVEVLSKSTRDYDVNEKLPAYKQIPGIQQIIYIDSQEMHVSTWLSTEVENQWLNMDFLTKNDKLPVLESEILMKDLYRKVTFEKSA